jgi:hypothetical protein
MIPGCTQIGKRPEAAPVLAQVTALVLNSMREFCPRKGWKGTERDRTVDGCRMVRARRQLPEIGERHRLFASCLLGGFAA